MAPTTAINFVFLGSALLLLVRPWGIRMAQWLALSVAGIGVLNLLGYTYGVPALYDLPAATAMAAHTAVAFVLLGLGILCAQPDRGVMATLTSPGVGGVMMREVLREIKWHPVYRTVPAVILTTSQEEVDVRTCYELGVTSYILKPVDFDKFLEVVGRIDLYWVLTNHPPPAAAPRHPDRPRAKGSVPQPEGFGPQATRRPREDV
jgi:CheY-like chemotaxis protein